MSITQRERDDAIFELSVYMDWYVRKDETPRPEWGALATKAWNAYCYEHWKVLISMTNTESVTHSVLDTAQRLREGWMPL